MTLEPLTLTGTHVRLEPLAPDHADALASASSNAGDLYRWSPVPATREDAVKYIATALAMRDADTAIPFAVVRLADGLVIGSTRFFNIERWPWPAGHPEHARATPDAVEIGYTWYAPTAVRTAVNTECKLLLLSHAFEKWKVHRVCLHTDIRNQRSRAAMERLGCKLEGILRAHRIAADLIPRDSARYSIIAAEWPEIKHRLIERLAS